ncbi:MAG: hypothetical protein H0X33_14480 [Taibaiella sp.]|nr:hypothetical protein [Taibaiella sp.]
MKKILVQYLGIIQSAIGLLGKETKEAYTAELNAIINAADGEEVAASDEFTNFVNHALADIKEEEADVKAAIASTLEPLKEANTHVEGWLKKIENAAAGELREIAEKISKFWHNVKSTFGVHDKPTLHFTDDGQAFFNVNDAAGHAQRLDNKEVTSVDRAHLDSLAPTWVPPTTPDAVAETAAVVGATQTEETPAPELPATETPAPETPAAEEKKSEALVDHGSDGE